MASVGMAKGAGRSSVTPWRSSQPPPAPLILSPTALALTPRSGTSWPIPVSRGSRGSPRPCPRRRRSSPRRNLRPWPRCLMGSALRSWPRVMVGARNAGGSATRTIASRRPSARSIRRGARKGPTPAKPARRWAARPLPVQRRPGRRAPVLGPAGTPRCSPTAPSASRPRMGSGGDQVLGPPARPDRLRAGRGPGVSAPGPSDPPRPAALW